jgi:simple sugar transport system ATP-binding protein
LQLLWLFCVCFFSRLPSAFFISHYFPEVYEICQAVTILRDARHIISALVPDLPREQSIEAMTDEQGSLSVTDAATRPPSRGDALVTLITVCKL